MKKLVLAGVVVVALALAACGDDDDSTATSTTTTTDEVTTTVEPGDGPTTTAAAPELNAVRVESTVGDWLKAVADGDDDAAIALLSQRSLDAIGGADGYKKMNIELAEGWGAWGRATGVALSTKTLKFPTNVAIVVLHGEISQEGPPRESWNALPVVSTDDGLRVEPFLDLGTVTVDPEEGSKIADGDQLTAITSHASDTWFIVDDGAAFMPALKDVSDTGARWLSPPLSGIDPGVHSLAVVVVGEGIMARSFEYTAS
jgi:hypothetical protein